MHQLTRPSALLGGQQALRLRQLQELGDDLVYRTHLQQQQQRVRPDRRAAPPPPSRTVEAVLDARREQQPSSGSTAARLRNKIDEARGSIRTERSERPDAFDRRTAPHRAANDDARPDAREPLVLRFPGVDDPDSSSPAVAATDDDDDCVSRRPTATQRRIGAVRRRANTPESAKDLPSRRLTKQELAWVETQLQFTQRAAALERECESWWRQYFGAASGVAGSTTAAAAIQRALDELPSARTQDARHLLQQLQALRAKLARVAHKLGEMRSGEAFYADLQQRIEDLEAAIAAFRGAQRAQFDAYSMEEKVLAKELSAFADRMREWEEAEASSEAPRIVRSAKSRPTRAREEEPASEDPAETPEADMMTRVRHLNALIAQSGGVRGGWDDREHRVFTSLLLRCGLPDDVLVQHHTFQLPSPSGRDDEQRSERRKTSAEEGAAAFDFEAAVARFLRKCVAKVATRSDDAVRGHLLWYVDHLQLLQQKKDAIAAWKARKARERQLLVQQGLVGGDCEDAENNAAGDSPSPGGRAAGGERIRRRSAEEEDEEQRRVVAAKSKAKTAKRLSEWREHKRLQEQDATKRERAAAREREALDAKRKQEQLEAKQKVLLYRLQKEQEDSARAQPQDGVGSPTDREELAARSRQAIEHAKARRAQLQALETRRLRQRALPARPPSARQSPPSPAPLLQQPTQASQARGLSKLEVRAKDAARRRLNAHDAFFPGADALPDARAKSFGHVAIQPRAVPAWRRGV